MDTAPFSDCLSTSTFTTDVLSDGPHTFEVRATDATGTDDTPASRSFIVDTVAPTTTIESGPVGTINTDSATFEFSSNDVDAIFECALDGVIETNCSSPKTYPGLPEGPHTFTVVARDQAGNIDPGAPARDFTVHTATVDPPGPPPAPPAPSAPVGTSVIAARPAASFVLIAGNTIRVSRRRTAGVELNCSGSKDCAGVLKLTTAKRIRLTRKRRRIVTLASKRFTIPARQTAEIDVRLSKRAFRIVQKLRRVTAMVTVTDIDNAGRARIGTREVNLRAR